MTAIEAMNEVNGYLNAGNIAGAQAAVVAIEAEQTVLPSSVFERVLRKAVESGELLPFYADFCKSAYGRDVYEVIEASAHIAASMGVKVA